MKVKTVFGIFPVFVFEGVMPDGRANGPFIRVPLFTTDGMMAHEMFHAKQFYVWFLSYAIVAALIWFLIPFMTFLPDISTLSPLERVFMVSPLAVISVLEWRNTKSQWRRECAAYAEHLRVMRDAQPETGSNFDIETWIETYARVLKFEPRYGFPFSKEQTAAQIRKRIKDGKLF